VPEGLEPFDEQAQVLNVAGMAPAALGAVSAAQVRQATLDSLRALMMIRAYRVRGHLRARLDPLELNPVREHPELDPKSYGFDDAAMSRPIFINYVLGLESATLREIMDKQTFSKFDGPGPGRIRLFYARIAESHRRLRLWWPTTGVRICEPSVLHPIR
jgi:hypothetical protein